MNDYELAKRALSQPDEQTIDQAVGAIQQRSTAFFDGLAEDLSARTQEGHPRALGLMAQMQPARAREVWQNWGGNQTVFPSELHDLSTLDLPNLQALARTATGRGGRLKVVGSGHSFSDIVSTEDVLLFRSKRDYRGMSPLAQAGRSDLWKPEYEPSQDFVRLACNARLHELDAAMMALPRPLAFHNLGGATVQTYAGAVSTSTHGSGRELTPLPDDVVSMLCVGSRGQLLQLEPTNGITDPAKFAARYPAGERTLLQSDRVFYSAVVSMGCMVLAVEMTVRVQPAYLLQEKRWLSTWSALRAELARGEHLDARHFEALVHPYPRPDGDRLCLLTRRDLAPPGASRNEEPHFRKVSQWFASLHPVQALIVWLVNSSPGFVPRLIDTAMQSIVTQQDYIDYSFKVFDLERIDEIRAVSAELAFSLEGAGYLDAVDALLKLMDDNRARRLYQSSPISLRFVAPSKAHLSMMHGRATCMVETPLLRGTHGALDALRSYEAAAMGFGGRPHWGQFHELTGKPGWLLGAYAKAEDWLQTFAELNADHTFDNHFTDRMGFWALAEQGAGAAPPAPAIPAPAVAVDRGVTAREPPQPPQGEEPPAPQPA